MKTAIRILALIVAAGSTSLAYAQPAAAVAPTIVVPAPGQIYEEPAYGMVGFTLDSAVALQVYKYAGCCEVEFQYKNAAGAWTANKPAVVENPGLISPKSPLPVSQFKASTD